MSNKAQYRDVRAILDAAGFHEPTPAQLRNAQRALNQTIAVRIPTLVNARERWRKRACALRDRFDPRLDWGAWEYRDEESVG